MSQRPFPLLFRLVLGLMLGAMLPGGASRVAFAFATPNYTISGPSGWKEQVKMFGMDVMFMGRMTGNRPQPIFGIVTVPKVMTSKEVPGFLEKSIVSDLKARRITTYKFLSKGKPKWLSAEAFAIDYEYAGDKVMMRDLSIVIRAKQRIHYVVFSAPREEYDFYFKDVSASLRTLKVKP